MSMSSMPIECGLGGVGEAQFLQVIEQNDGGSSTAEGK